MSRSNATSRSLRLRPSRTVPSTIVALAVTTVGVLAVIAGISRIAVGDWPSAVTSTAAPVATWTWGSMAAATTSVIIFVVGVVLLVAAIKPGAYTSAPLTPPGSPADGQTVGAADYVISHRAIARLAAASADDVDGVDGVAAAATGTRVNVRIASSARQSAELGRLVQQRVIDTLTAAGLNPVPRVSVRAKGS